MSKLHQEVFLVEDGQILKRRICDFTGWVDETPSPRGVEPRYHIRDATQVWAWGYMGSSPRLLRHCSTPEQAQEYLEELHLDSFWSWVCSSGPIVHASLEQAQEFLRDMQE